MICLLAGSAAHAGHCSDPPPVISSGLTVNYLSNAGSTNITSSTVTGSCTKTGGNTDTYTVVADTGLNPSGGSNRGQNGANFINYTVSTLSNCGNQWNGANFFTFSFTSSGSSMQTYYGCVPAGQWLAALTYSDTVTMTTTHRGTPFTSTFPVSITVQPICIIATAPSNLTINDTAFGAAVNVSTNFGIQCNNLLPYSMSLGATNPIYGVASGVQYSLTLSATSGNGNGLAQTYSIAGNAAAGQAGTCTTGSCSNTDVQTLTISY